MFWGITPALDLQEEYKCHCEPPKKLDILLIGGCDARHILKTISKKYQHEAIVINFYCVEVCPEVIARQLILLIVALESPNLFGLKQRTKIFMEIYGNLLVRPEVSNYINCKAKQMVEVITELKESKPILKNIELHELKYKERDYLELLFKYWSAADPCVICRIWNRRLRQSLGVRYDSRIGVFDWDLHMRLHSAGATQICGQEYKHWRETGVAFTWLESEVSKPNRTFVAGVVPNGDKFIHHGYVGDMISGPFYGYGLDCKNKDLLKKQNHMNVNRATDVTEYNCLTMFYEILHQEDCPFEKLCDLKMGTVVVDLPNERIVEENSTDTNEKKMFTQNIDLIHLENVMIKFLSASALKSMTYKEEYKNLFDIIYFSNLVVNKIDTSLINTIANKNCELIIENQVYVPSIKKDTLQEEATKLKEQLGTLSNATELPFDAIKDCYAKYIIN